jgi:hypothetical protein
MSSQVMQPGLAHEAPGDVFFEWSRHTGRLHLHR